jgi:hypothetical protein
MPRNRLDALVLCAAALATSCGGGPANTLGTAFCNKVEACEGMHLSAADRQSCEHAVNLAFGAVPDPPGAIACLTSTSCPALMTDPMGIAKSCVDVDPASYACKGDTLHLCNRKGVCNDIDCPSFCADFQLTYISCGFSQQDGFDKCLCHT